MICCAAWLWYGNRAAASEQFREFLEALQERGYGDSAANYLTLIRSRDDLPDDLREVIDLEMATSLRIAAANTPNADEAARNLGAAQQYLDKFVREHPDHPESGMAYASYGDLASARAESWLKTALATNDKEEQGSLLGKARAAYQEARSAYDRGAKACQARLDRAKEGPKEGERTTDHPARVRHGTTQSDAEAIEARFVQVRFKEVMVDYQIAKTYLTPMSAERKAALLAATKGFDDIYQHYRTYQAGLYSHFWHGKTLVELGDLETALDVLDEVLANAPDPQDRDADPAFGELFAQVEQMRLTILSQQGHLGELMAEAEEWLRENKSLQRSDGYQGVALELAKGQLTKAERQAGEVRRKAMQGVKVALARIAAKPGAFQQEAILLQRKLRSQGDDAEPASFDEALAVADAAATAGDTEGAVAGYRRAIELARDGKKTQPRANEARLRLARSLWSAGEFAACLDAAEAIVDDSSAGAQAPAAAALSIHAALRLVSAPRAPGAEKGRLAQVADKIVRRWPQSVEADEARMALGKMALLKGDDERALASFAAVNAASPQYPVALHWSAVVHWRRYWRAKGEPADRRDNAAMTAERDHALEALTASLKAQGTATDAVGASREQMESQVLLAEIDLEGGQIEEAAALVGPLVPAIKALPPSEQDTLATRALLAALRAQLLRKDLAAAEEPALALVERGGKSPQASAVLLEFARLLRNQVKETGSAGEGIPPTADAPPSETAAAPAQGGSQRQALSKVIEYLAQRPPSSAAAMLFVAETLGDLGKADEARGQYQAILERADKDPKWLGGDRSLTTRVRAKLLAFLRAEGRLEDALGQADRLVKENPKSLEPRLERAQILQAWAATEPDRYAAAVAQWTELRTALQNVRPRPKEYYDVVYNAAWCLAAQSEHKGDKTPAHQAEQLLKSVLVVSPDLDGEETVAEYRQLVDRCVTLQADRKEEKNATVKKDAKRKLPADKTKVGRR
ncbi:MAG TPA: tetratricopeptide repeat protein [Pirellulales bacterium]|nr:tetratricopeptide repeat protein [Pirellulales bacterium]